MQEEIKCRWAPSLGRLEESSDMIWGTTLYNPDTDKELPCVFFGLYGLPDFFALWQHKGKRWVLFAGTDIVHLSNGYWLTDGGTIKLDTEPIAKWINENCENWCENEVERKALEDIGIQAEVCPSFLGHIENYPISFTPNERPQVYVSVSGDNFQMYGWDIVERIADKCDVDFHLYGNTKEWDTKHSNVFVHGRIPKEEMNEQIKNMQCGLRLCMPDGFSEVIAKSILWGQYPLAWRAFQYPGIDSFASESELIKHLNQLKYKTEPNPAREYYITRLNSFPFNIKKYESKK
jgi:hypothetical protein